VAAVKDGEAVTRKKWFGIPQCHRPSYHFNEIDAALKSAAGTCRELMPWEAAPRRVYQQPAARGLALPRNSPALLTPRFATSFLI